MLFKFKLLFILILFFISIPPFVRAQSSTDFVRVSGRNLVYKGQTILLRGANIHNIEALCSRYGSGGNWGSCNPNDIRIREVDYQRLAQEGGNHFRFGMAYRWYQDNPQQMFQVLDQHILWARKHGIWLTFVVFTLPGDCYEGFVQQSCPFWNNSSYKSSFKQFWVDMATRYKNEPAIAGYDLINEPFPPSYNAWKDYANEVVSAIRTVDTNHAILFSSISDPSFPALLNDSNIIYQVHDYTPMAMSHSSNPTVYPGVSSEWCGSVLWSKKTITGQSDVLNGTTYPSTSCNNLKLRLNLDTAVQRNVPMYIGEWGPQYFSNFSGGYNYIKDRGEAYAEFGISQAFYSWKHSQNNWSIFPNQVDSSATSMTPWFPNVLAAVKIGWAGSVRPNFTTGGISTPFPTSPVPTSTLPTMTPIVSTVPTNTQTPGTSSIQLVTPLSFSDRFVTSNETVNATVTYKNNGTVAASLTIIIAARPPGGTNVGGPYFDFSPSASVTLQPGQSYTMNASKTFSNTDPSGTWYAYSTYKLGSVWFDAETNKNISFSVNDTLDGQDYIVWINNYNQRHTAGATKGDYNYDGITDGLDYIVWLSNYST